MYERNRHKIVVSPAKFDELISQIMLGNYLCRDVLGAQENPTNIGMTIEEEMKREYIFVRIGTFFFKAHRIQFKKPPTPPSGKMVGK